MLYKGVRYMKGMGYMKVIHPKFVRLIPTLGRERGGITSQPYYTTVQSAQVLKWNDRCNIAIISAIKLI